jgi:hypothetical protein
VVNAVGFAAAYHRAAVTGPMQIRVISSTRPCVGTRRASIGWLVRAAVEAPSVALERYIVAG